MKRNVLFGAVVVTAMTVGIGAQSGQSGSDQPSRRMQKGSDATTITGCLQAADGSGNAVGTSGSTGTAGSSASSADHFVLASAAKSEGASSATASPSANAPTATAGASATGTTSDDNSFVLTGGEKEELRRLVNSKVEIQGKVEESPAAGTHNNGTSSNAGTTGSAMSTGSRAPETKSSGRTLRIESIRQVAASCS